MLRFAIPSKGRLQERANAFFARAGLRLRQEGGSRDYRGAFEGVMRNYRGELSECTQSNLFIVTKGDAFTPAIESGLLAGITSLW